MRLARRLNLFASGAGARRMFSAAAATTTASLERAVTKALSRGGGEQDLSAVLAGRDAASLHKLVDKLSAARDYEKAAAVFKSGPREFKSEIRAVLSAMTAYSRMKQPGAAKQVLLNWKAAAANPMTTELQAKTLEILLLGYSRADKLDYVEGILYEWLSRTSSPSSSSWLQELAIRKRPKVAEDLNKAVGLVDKDGGGGGGSGDYVAAPGLATWEAVSRLYATRFAWEQCVKVLGLAAKQFPSSKELGRLQHITVRALCDGGQFARALELIEEMRRGGAGHLGSTYLLTHLLKYYRHHDGGLVIDKLLPEQEIESVGEEDGEAVELEGLTSAVVSLLCLRGQADEADEAIRRRMGSGEEEGGGSVRPSAVVMVINAHVKKDQWGKAEDLFWAARKAGALDDYHATLAYHHVCEGMRNAKQFQALAHFMESKPVVQSKAAK